MPSICSHGPVLHTVVSKFDARRSWVQILRTSSSQGRRRARKVTGVEHQLWEDVSLVLPVTDYAALGPAGWVFSCPCLGGTELPRDPEPAEDHARGR